MKRRQTPILILASCLVACSPGPSSVKQIATQGLLSGELTRKGEAAVIGSVHHGGSYWDTKRKERVYAWNHQAEGFSSIRASAISGNGKRAVTCEGRNLVLWETTEGSSLQFWQASDRIQSIKLNNEGTKALMGLRDGAVSYFDLDRGVEIHRFMHDAEVRAVDINKDGSIAISGADDNIAKVWDLRRGEEINSLALDNQIKTVAISDSGKLAFTTAQREDTLVWEVDSGKAAFKFTNRYINYTTADFSDDEKFLTAGTFQGEIYKWDIRSGKEIAKWQAKPRKAFGGAASKAIVDVVDLKSTVVALTSDGMFQSFKR